MAEQFVQRIGAGNKPEERITLTGAEDLLRTQQADKFQDVTKFTSMQRLQQVSDLGAFSPIKAPPGISETPQPNQGTGAIRDEITSDTKDVADAIGQAESGAEPGPSAIERLQEERKRINEQTDEDISAIDAAGASAGAAFDPLIEESVERRRTTLPTAIVRAGEAGGFESTQMAGVAALLPTKPREGEAFVGAGGRLDRVRQDLDRNVSLLRSKQQEAIQSARAAQAKAIRTNKRADFQDAKDLIKLAQDFKNDAEDMLIKRNKFLLDVQAEERLGAKSAFDIASDIPEGETVVIGDQEFTGIAKENVDPFWTSSSLVSLAKEIPVGESRIVNDPKLGEITVQGLSTDDPSVKTIQSTNDAGETTITSYKLTEAGGVELINQASAGRVGKTKQKAASTTVILKEQQGGALGDASVALEGAVGTDGKTNTDMFIKERNKFIQSVGNSKAFDESFSHLLSERGDDPKATELRTRLDLPAVEQGLSGTEIESLRGFGIDQSTIDAAVASGMSFKELMGN